MHETLMERIVEVELAMARLAKNYTASIPNCRLVLYPKIERRHFGRGSAARPNPRFNGGRPRGLYWGRLTRTRAVIHLKGRLRRWMIFKIALRWNRLPEFFAFERERLRLNRMRRILVRARAMARRITLTEQQVQDSMANLAREFQGVAGLRLVRRLVDSRCQNRRLHFGLGSRSIPPQALTKGRLAALGVDRAQFRFLHAVRQRAATLNRQATNLRRRLDRVRRALASLTLPLEGRKD